MTSTLEWHQECLNNQKLYLDRQQKELKQLEQATIRLRLDITFLEYQINTAKDTRKKGFDSDRYLQKQRKEFNDVHGIQ